jgi:benzoyl-CoA 2,3-dioxygenase component A
VGQSAGAGGIRRRRAGAEVPSEVSEQTAIATVGQGGHASPPWSASHPYVNLYSPSKPAIATVTGNFRLTAEDASADIRHIVLDFGNAAFPVLEGQSLGILPPGLDRNGKPHFVRLYSVASRGTANGRATTTSR